MPAREGGAVNDIPVLNPKSTLFGPVKVTPAPANAIPRIKQYAQLDVPLPAPTDTVVAADVLEPKYITLADVPVKVKFPVIVVVAAF